MDIFKFAMQMEMDGKRFYETQAAKTSDPSLREILTTLAEEEQRHYEFFAKLRNGETENATRELNGKTKTLEKVQNIFVEMSNNNDNTTFGDDDLAAWTEALSIEEKAEKFYRDKAAEESDANKKRLLNLIADEERNHVHMIDGVLTFMKHPQSFAESAQFQNFQSLEGH